MSISVMIVDANEAEAALTARALRRSGFEIAVVHASEAALVECALAPPHLVVLDYDLPGMDGLQLLTALKERLPDTVAVMLTAAGDVEIAVEALSRGAATFLVKDPMGRHRRVLAAKLRRLLEQRRLSREKVRTEAVLAAALAEVERRNQRLRDFTRLLVHDLRAPVRHVRMLIDLALEDCEGQALPPVLQETLDRLTRSADRMDQLITDTLALARDEDRSRLKLVDLSAVCADVLADFDGQGAEIEVGALPTVKGDPVQLRHLIQNLVDNAVKYQSPARPCRIQVRGHTERKLHVVEVIDNGLGFDPAAAEGIFEPFRRLGSGPGGTGLGLSICRQIVEGAGGRITATGRPDEGATFRIEWPTERLESTGPAPALLGDLRPLAPVLSEKALDHAPDAMLVHDDDGRFIYANHAAARLLRYDREALVGMNLADLEPDFDLFGVREYWRKMQLGESVRTRGRPTAADGQPVPVDVRMALVNVTPARWYLVTLRARQAPGGSLHRRQSQPFRAVLEAAPELALLYDTSGQILFANHRASELLRYGRDELTRLNVAVLDPGAARGGWVEPPLRLPTHLRTEDDRLVPFELAGVEVEWEGRVAFLVTARLT